MENEFYPYTPPPKKKESQHMFDYRPISLGNVVSRMVSKVIANRLKLILLNVISDAQSAFVPNQLITDNTTVDLKFYIGCEIKGREKGADGDKVDISKAYDRVEWAFLPKVMLKLGLDEKWVQLAMETICIATYSVLINEESKGFITPTRGI